MHWSTVLYKAAERFDGGPRSFPPASEAGFASEYGYEPPNEEYEKLFFHQAAVSRSQRNQDASPHSAGWLIPDPDDASVCKPVFVAHSVLSAIWLLRETLADDALPNDGWDRLVRAAQSLAEHGVEAPPSAQNPSASPLLDYRKRPAPSAQASSAQASSPKRTRTEADVSRPASPQPSTPSESGEQLAERTTTTVTNNNRRAERERSKKLEAALVKNRLTLGLVAPDDKATRGEHGAYASIAPKDESVIAWIIKQPAIDSKRKKLDFYNAFKTPYLRACDFLAKARALGNPSSQEHAAQFLQAWRKRGTLFGGGVAARHNAPPSQQQRLRTIARPSQLDDADRAFCSAWERCNLYDEVMKSVHIEYRWAQALLGQAYANKMAQIQHDDLISSNDRTPNRYGKGLVRSEAINALVQLVNPNCTEKEREAFRTRLAIASKWYEIAERLGWGVFMVMPEDSISKTWIEHTIRAWGLKVFIELVTRQRPDVCLATKAFDTWLGPEGIAGGPIGGKKTLSIELEAPATIREVEEIQDSEDDEDDDSEDDEADGRVEILQPQVLPKSPAPAVALRQTTLLELFNPVA